MIYVGSADTKKVTLTAESQNIREKWLRVNKDQLSPMGLVLASLNQFHTSEDLEGLGGEQKVFDANFKPSNNMTDYVVVFQYHNLRVPCLVVPILNLKRRGLSLFEKYFLAFKPSQMAPIHLIPFEHAKEEIAAQICDTKPHNLLEAWFVPRNPDQFQKVNIEEIATEG